MRPTLLLAALLLALPARAGEPLATEDASVLPKGACQLEAVYRHEAGTRSWFALPACSVVDDLEIGAGGAVYRDDEAGSHALLLLQAKAVLFRSADERWGAGALIAIGRDTARASERRRFHDAAALAIVSYAPPDDAWRLHGNGGVVRSRGEFTTGVWGAAAEYDVAERWTLLGEAFRDGPGRPAWQVGVRYTVVPDRLELFASGGDRFGSANDAWYLKAGLRVQSPELW